MKLDLFKEIAVLLQEDEGAWTIAEVADWLKVPAVRCDRILGQMAAAGLVAVVSIGDGLRYCWKTYAVSGA